MRGVIAIPGRAESIIKLRPGRAGKCAHSLPLNQGIHLRPWPSAKARLLAGLALWDAHLGGCCVFSCSMLSFMIGCTAMEALAR